MTAESSAPGGTVSRFRAVLELFLISVVILFLELACIRWFPSHVLFLTFFTNTVLLACFLGMSVGCLAADRKTHFLAWTPILLAFAMAAGHGVELIRTSKKVLLDVGHQTSPAVVFFGTEYGAQDPAKFVIPIEAVGGFFFLVLALALVGPGQELGRALNRLPNRVAAYTINIFGSVVGIVLFALYSWYEMTPLWWMLPIVAGVFYFLIAHRLVRGFVETVLQAICLAAVVLMASLTSGEYPVKAALASLAKQFGISYEPGEAVEGRHFWSPYYRIDYDYPPRRHIAVNLIGHQMMWGLNETYPAYALPHLFNRDAGGKPFGDVLIIGAGSGSDVARALQWGAKQIDAVEIDPVILSLGKKDHPDHPYQDLRVTAHLNDGRNFLRTTDKKYDLIVYALVDSLVLHSSYSNIRLESYLFTDEAFRDVKSRLKSDGLFVMYNYFRKGWIVARLEKGLENVFGAKPLVFTLPYREKVEPEYSGGFTLFICGEATAVKPIRDAFERKPAFWLSNERAPSPSSPNGFEQQPPPPGKEKNWERYGLTTVARPDNLEIPTDDYPFLYLRERMIPTQPSLSGMGVMAVLSVVLILLFLPRSGGQGKRFGFSGRMFFLGAGFMLIETKAVVNMAILFGSTWMVNTVVFFAVLVMILVANLFVLAFKPEKLWFYFVGLTITLALNALIPMNTFLGMEQPLRTVGSCALVFAPILFAAVIFAVSFSRSADPGRDFGANIAGAILGGLAENSSMILGFQYLVLVGLGFYLLSALFRSPKPLAGLAPAVPNSPGL